MDPHDLLEKVNDQKSFLEFVRALAADKKEETEKEKNNPSAPYSRGVNGWENGTIEAYLDACVRWAESTNFGESKVLKIENEWKRFAVFLYCGKIYE